MDVTTRARSCDRVFLGMTDAGGKSSRMMVKGTCILLLDAMTHVNQMCNMMWATAFTDTTAWLNGRHGETWRWQRTTIRMEGSSHSSAPFSRQHHASVSVCSHCQAPKQDLGTLECKSSWCSISQTEQPLFDKPWRERGWVGGEIGMDNINVSTPV